MGAYLRKRGSELARDLEWVYTLFPALLSKRRAVAATLSGGEGQMLAIGRALMAAPRLVLLDEPSQGLAPVLVDQSFELIARLRTDRDMGILLVEQNANKALEVASYGYVLEAGALAFEGTTAELQSSTRVRELYLGG